MRASREGLEPQRQDEVVTIFTSTDSPTEPGRSDERVRHESGSLATLPYRAHHRDHAVHNVVDVCEVPGQRWIVVEREFVALVDL